MLQHTEGCVCRVAKNQKVGSAKNLQVREKIQGCWEKRCKAKRDEEGDAKDRGESQPSVSSLQDQLSRQHVGPRV